MFSSVLVETTLVLLSVHAQKVAEKYHSTISENDDRAIPDCGIRAFLLAYFRKATVERGIRVRMVAQVLPDSLSKRVLVGREPGFERVPERRGRPQELFGRREECPIA